MALETEVRAIIAGAVKSQNTISLNNEEIGTLTRVASGVIRDYEHLLRTNAGRTELANLISASLMHDQESRRILRNATGTYVKTLDRSTRVAYSVAPQSRVDKRIRSELVTPLAEVLNANHKELIRALTPHPNYHRDRNRLRELERGNTVAAVSGEENLGGLSPDIVTAAPDRPGNLVRG